MELNIDALHKLAQDEDWSIPKLAEKIGVDYSHLFRVINRQKNAGAKLFTGLYMLCKEKNLNYENYIFLNNPLSVDNGEAEQKQNTTTG